MNTTLKSLFILYSVHFPRMDRGFGEGTSGFAGHHHPVTTEETPKTCESRPVHTLHSMHATGQWVPGSSPALSSVRPCRAYTCTKPNQGTCLGWICDAQRTRANSRTVTRQSQRPMWGMGATDGIPFSTFQVPASQLFQSVQKKPVSIFKSEPQGIAWMVRMTWTARERDSIY